ncbi:hypothetical protein ABPG74_020004 [Tetrahymena malaccensis]
MYDEKQDGGNDQNHVILLQEIEDMEIVIKVLEIIIYIFDKNLQYMLVPKYSNKYQFLKELTISLFADLEKYYDKCKHFCECCMELIFRRSSNPQTVQKIYQFYCDFIKFTKNIQKVEFVLNFCKPLDVKKIEYFQVNVNKNKEIEMFVNNISKVEQIEPKNTTIFSKLGSQERQGIAFSSNNKQQSEGKQNYLNNDKNMGKEDIKCQNKQLSGKEIRFASNIDLLGNENKQLFIACNEIKGDGQNQQRNFEKNQVTDKNNLNKCSQHSEIFFKSTDQKNTENQSQVFENQNYFSSQKNAIKQNNFIETHCEEAIKCNKCNNTNLLKQSKTQEMYFESNQQQNDPLNKNIRKNQNTKSKDSVSSTKAQKSEHAYQEEEKLSDIQFINAKKSQTNENSPLKYVNENSKYSQKEHLEVPKKFYNQIFQFELSNYHQSKQGLSDNGIESNYESRSNLKQKFQHINDFGTISNSSSPESIKETSKSSNNQSKNKITPLHKAQHYSTKNSSEYDDFNYYSSSNLFGNKNTQKNNYPNSCFSPKIKNDQKSFSPSKNFEILGQKSQKESVQSSNLILNLMQKVENKEEKSIISNIFNSIKKHDSEAENKVESSIQQEKLKSNINSQIIHSSEFSQLESNGIIKLDEQHDSISNQPLQKQVSQSVKSSQKRFNFGNNFKQKKVRNINTASLVNVEHYYMSDQESEHEQNTLKISKVVKKVIPDQKTKEITEQKDQLECSDQIQYQCKEIFSIQEEQNHQSLQQIPSFQKLNSITKVENPSSQQNPSLQDLDLETQISPNHLDKQERNQKQETNKQSKKIENTSQDIKLNQENQQIDLLNLKKSQQDKISSESQNNTDAINQSNTIQQDDFQMIATSQIQNLNLEQFLIDKTYKKQQESSENNKHIQIDFQNIFEEPPCQINQINDNQKDSFNLDLRDQICKNDSFNLNHKEIKYFKEQNCLNLNEESEDNYSSDFKVNKIDTPHSPQTSKAFHNKFFLGNKHFSSFVESNERPNYQNKMKTPLKLKSYRSDQQQPTNQDGLSNQTKTSERSSFRSIRRFSRNKQNNSSNKFFQESIIDNQQVQQIIKQQNESSKQPKSSLKVSQIQGSYQSSIESSNHQTDQGLKSNQTLSTIASYVQQQGTSYIFNNNTSSKFNIESKTFSNQSAIICSNISNILISQKQQKNALITQDSQKIKKLESQEENQLNNKMLDQLFTNQSICNTQENTSNFFSKKKEFPEEQQKMQTEGGTTIQTEEDVEKQRLFTGSSFRRSIYLKTSNETPKQKDQEQFQKQLSDQHDLDLKLHKSNSSQQNQILSHIKNQNILEAAVKAIQSASVRNVSYSQHQQQKKGINFQGLILSNAKDINSNDPKNQLDSLKSYITNKYNATLQLNSDKRTNFLQNKERAITIIDQQLNDNNNNRFFDKINSSQQAQLNLNQNQKSFQANKSQNVNPLKTFYQDNKLILNDINTETYKNVIPFNQSHLSNQSSQFFSSSLKNHYDNQNQNLLGQKPKLNYHSILADVPFKSQKTISDQHLDHQQLLSQI